MSSSKKKSATESRERKNIGLKIRTIVLTEAGYRCAVPTCRQILALDLHHMLQVSEGGGDMPSNLIALCPTCHALYHRGTISEESIYSYKTILVSLSQAFDLQGVDQLLFLAPQKKQSPLIVTGDGLLHFARLIAAGLAEFTMAANNNNQIVTYSISISKKGKLLVDAWKTGKRSIIAEALGAPKTSLL
jgi:HNH endonuclease